MLAELLVEAGRLGQAEQILDLLKEQELKDAVSGATPALAAGIEPLKLSPAQQKAESAVARSREKSAGRRGVELSPTRRFRPSPRAPRTTMRNSRSLQAQPFSRKSATFSPYSRTRSFPNSMRNPRPARLPLTLQRAFFRTRLRNSVRVSWAFACSSATITPTPSSLPPPRGKVSCCRLRRPTSAPGHLKRSKPSARPASDPRPQLNQLYSMIVAPLEGQSSPRSNAVQRHGAKAASPRCSGRSTMHCATCPSARFTTATITWSSDFITFSSLPRATAT